MSWVSSVKIFLFRNTPWRTFFIIILTLVIADLRPAAAGSGEANKTNRPAERITITADELVSDSVSKVADFRGHVKVTRGESVITADRLKIYYADTAQNKNNRINPKTAIKQIVAEGNVRIKSEDLIAAAQKAVYSRDTQIIILSGPNTKVSSGKNSIVGSKIELYLENEQFKVLGGRKGRVTAIINQAPKK
jgi:lipopolysaccharide export system protein LptA